MLHFKNLNKKDACHIHRIMSLFQALSWLCPCDINLFPPDATNFQLLLPLMVENT